MDKELTCIVCPIGCSLIAEIEDNIVISVKGNTCARGKVYAENECTNPMRTITSTIKCSDGSMVSVKTDSNIPKEKIFECMDIINRITIDPPVNVGDILIENIFGSNIIATQNSHK